jgi:lysozyme
MKNKVFMVIPLLFLFTLRSRKVKAEELISRFEGLRLKAYQDVGGIWTIGYGSITDPFTGIPVKRGDVITKDTALTWLKKEIETKLAGIKKLIKVPVTENQLTALTSLAYNIGTGAFSRSTLLRLLNSKAPKTDIANEFLKWNKVRGKEVKGLTNRRILEKDLFLS